VEEHDERHPMNKAQVIAQQSHHEDQDEKDDKVRQRGHYKGRTRQNASILCNMCVETIHALMLSLPMR